MFDFETDAFQRGVMVSLFMAIVTGLILINMFEGRGL